MRVSGTALCRQVMDLHELRELTEAGKNRYSGSDKSNINPQCLARMSVIPEVSCGTVRLARRTGSTCKLRHDR